MKTIKLPKKKDRNGRWIALPLLSIFFLLDACQSPDDTQQADFQTVDIRSVINKDSQLDWNNHIQSSRYIQLQETNDEASLIDGISDFALSDQYIFILPIKERRIAMFDREGHFIKTLIKEGPGPDEFNGMLSGIQYDKQSNHLFLFGNKISEYTLEGKLVRSVNQTRPTMFVRSLSPERFGAVAMAFMPFQNGSFGIGVIDDKDSLLFHKNDFYSPLVAPEKSGLTTHLASALSEYNHTMLFKIAGNDTLFRITTDTILPACVLRLDNSEEEIKRALDITDFSDIPGLKRDNRDIFVQDIQETKDYFYFRCRYNQGFNLIAVNKRTGEVLNERCEQPAPLQELAKNGTFVYGLLGSRSYNNFPVWGQFIGKELVQVVTPSELSAFKDMNSVTIPEELKNIDEEGNPIFIIHQLK